MITVKNLTNSPYDLPTVGGFVRLPAFGEVSGDFTGEYLQLLKSSRAVELLNAPIKTSSKPAEDTDRMTKLRADYLGVVGKKPYHGWSAEELQAKIDEKLGE